MRHDTSMADGFYRAGCPAPLISQGNIPTDDGGAIDSSTVSVVLLTDKHSQISQADSA